jgi:23S rRNA (uracil1939-C5)-methyltransferase
VTERLTLDIESIAAGGDGIARHEGLVVFVPRTAPGDRVVARVERGRRFARGTVERIERVSDDRVQPACPHYDGDRCGGCQLQHLSAAAQAAAKRGIVRDNIRRIGHRTVELPVLHSAGPAWRYRTRLSLALRPEGEGWRAGFHRYDAPDDVFALDDCHLAHEDVMALWRASRAADAFLPGRSDLRVTISAAAGRAALAVEGASAWPDATRFARALPGGTGVWWTPEGGRRRRVDAGPADAPGASFSQVNPHVAASLHAHVEAAVVAAAPRHVVDAYSGTGRLAVALHANGIAVTAIELDAEASAFAASRLGRPSRAIAARAEDVIGSVLPADVIVVNPPRAGLHPRVTAALEASAGGATAIVYVSCDPATLARDVSRLPSWDIAALDAFDMFPQTAHVETVAVLRSRRSA